MTLLTALAAFTFVALVAVTIGWLRERRLEDDE